MMNKEEYKKEIVRMWDSLRDDKYKIYNACNGVSCRKCPLHGVGCSEPLSSYEIVEIIKKWSNEHPQEKYKVSKLEYSILEAYMDLSNCGSVKMLDFPVFNRLHELGYFKGVTKDMYIKDYFSNCEVEEDDG